jgi:hypothetical protein
MKTFLNFIKILLIAIAAFAIIFLIGFFFSSIGLKLN